jgi:hypothetical protein
MAGEGLACADCSSRGDSGECLNPQLNLTKPTLLAGEGLACADCSSRGDSGECLNPQLNLTKPTLLAGQGLACNKPQHFLNPTKPN